MCEANADFTTVAGTRERVEWMMGHWEGMPLITGRTLPEHGIHLEWPDLAELGDEYRDPECGAVAVAWHEPGGGTRAAAVVSSALLLANHGAAPGLVCEPGHTFAGEQAAPGAASLDEEQLTRARQRVPQLPQREGSRLALLDTGDEASDIAVDFTAGQPNTSPSSGDPHGHGSAVAQTVRRVCPHADIRTFRVLGSNNKGSSLSIYLGLIAALWDGQAVDVVNASLSVEAKTECGTSLGATFGYLMTLRYAQKRSDEPPTLVVAAGNRRGGLRSPATVAGARVVTAIDWDGNPAPYCNKLDEMPSSVVAHEAPGGVRGDPLGQYANGDEVYGTSFAAGFVSGALLAPRLTHYVL